MNNTQRAYPAKRVDKNQPSIVKEFRKYGVTVSHTHEVGKGFPDVVVGVEGLSIIGDTTELRKILKSLEGLKIIDGVNLLVEIKDNTKPPSKRKLSEPEEEWHSKWKGQATIVGSNEDIKDLLEPLTKLTK
jgi:hypothetical protein